MEASALSEKQRESVDALVAKGMLLKLESDGDLNRAQSFLHNAQEALAELDHVQSSLVRHDLAYAIMHDVGEALLAAYGYRTTPKSQGQHQAVAQFMTAIFDTPPADEAAAMVDDVRRRRNDRYYKAGSPSKSEADLAVENALVLFRAAAAQLSPRDK